MRLALILAVLASCGVARAETATHVAIFVGANEGSSSDEPLRYARSDAERVRTALIELGDVSPERAILVTEGRRASVERALDEARGRVAELAAAGHEAIFVFYYSGHGDAVALHLGPDRFSLTELRASIDRIRARVRVVVLDACRTGGSPKGVHPGPSYALSVTEEVHGTVELSASSAGEAAQESQELGGAVFTHYFVSALRGAADLDGDGRISLLEAYGYTYRHTVLRTSGAELLQHPAWSTDLAGSGELVLSTPARAGLVIEMPRGDDRYLVFHERSATPMGEASGSGVPKLAVPPGRYLVARRAPGRYAIAVADGAWGGRLQLRGSDFRPVSQDQLAPRGAPIEVLPWRLDAQLGGEWIPRAADAGAGRLGVRLTRLRGPLLASLQISYIAAAVGTPTLVGVGHTIAIEPSLGARYIRERLTVSGQLGLELREQLERLVRRDARLAQQAGYGTEATRRAFGLGPRLEIALGVALGHNLEASTWVGATLLVRPEHDALAHTTLVAHGVLGGGFRLGRAF